MYLKYFVLFFFLTFECTTALQSQISKKLLNGSPREGENVLQNQVSGIFNSTPVILEGEKRNGDYVIGPEIMVTGATGFYDYQTNGECKHFVNRFAFDNLCAVFTVATDSTNVSNSRRTVFCFSTDDGATWYFDHVPQGIKSGFPSLTVKTTGEAVITNHHLVSGITRGVLYVDIAPLAATFSQYVTPYNIAWPGCSILSNGNIMVAGSTYHNSAATDTGIISIFNGLNFVNTTRFLGNNVFDHDQMRWTYAAGPGGKALYVLDPLNDIGGNNDHNRIFITFTTNFGASWTQPMIEFYNPQVLLGEYAVPYLGLDAIYDAAGNYYVAFNTMNTAVEYTSARMWVSKNGGTPVLVAQHFGVNGIPEAASDVVSPQTGICTIDHPSLSLSSDGTILYIAYSVVNQNDVVNSFNKCHIYMSTSLTSSLQFSEPIRITNSGSTSYDERYVSIAQKTPDFGSPNGKTVYMVYQKDPQAGSSSFMDIAPLSRASLVFRKISGLSYPVTGINSNNVTPKEYRLSQNTPNPFNPATTINYSIPAAGNVELVVYNILGENVAFLQSRFQQAGNYTVNFNAADLPSGVYMYRLTSGSYSESKKMVLVK
jgi:hypothetical protein